MIVSALLVGSAVGGVRPSFTLIFCSICPPALPRLPCRIGDLHWTDLGA